MTLNSRWPQSHKEVDGWIKSWTLFWHRLGHHIPDRVDLTFPWATHIWLAPGGLKTNWIPFLIKLSHNTSCFVHLIPSSGTSLSTYKICAIVALQSRNGSSPGHEMTKTLNGTVRIKGCNMFHVNCIDLPGRLKLHHISLHVSVNSSLESSRTMSSPAQSMAVQSCNKQYI